jgi:periplasmic protein CpxP/Spy
MFDKTLLALTVFLPLFRWRRVLISVRKNSSFPLRSQQFMKSIRFRFLVAALAVMLAGAIAQAQSADVPPPAPPVHGHEFGMGHPMMGFFAKYLDVTDAQREQMKAVLQKEHTTMKPLMQQLHQMEQQLKQYEEGTYDDAKVQALVAQQSQTLVQLRVQETRIHSELFQLLTPDQQAKMKQFEANREARMQQHAQDASSAAPEE